MSRLEHSLPGDLGHLNRLIEAWGDEEPETEGVPHPKRQTTQKRRRRLVGVMAFAGAIDGLRDEDGVPRIAFKGGTALELRFGFRARTSQDLDAVFRGELDEALSLIEGALEAGWNGFTGSLGPVEEITRAQLPVNPRRVKIKIRYKSKPFVTIPFELGIAEGKSLIEPELAVTVLTLEVLRLPFPENIPLLPVRYQIAQKLHACTEDDGVSSNERVRDLADITLLQLLAVSPLDLAGIREACLETFDGRGKHSWPPQIIEQPGWRTLWEALAQTEDIDETLDEAIARVSAFVKEIDSSPMVPID